LFAAQSDNAVAMAILFEQPALIILAFVTVGLIAGFVKGAVGFAMPMIMVSGLGTLLSPELAIATLILPTFVSNLLQALRTGVRAAYESAKKHRLYLLICLSMILVTAQLVTSIERWVLYLILGTPVTFFAALQLIGWRPSVNPSNSRPVEIGVALFAGALGGLSGMWGPPTVLYLTALDIAKRENLRVQGVIYCAGTMVLLSAHLKSGIFNAQTWSLSALMLLPAGIGLFSGMAVQSKLDQAKFRKITLVVLIVAGLNLIRRGVLG
jgi:uncharacterized membrane protein YfcA